MAAFARHHRIFAIEVEVKSSTGVDTEAPAGVNDDGSTGPCASANNITKQTGRADPASWPLHSLPNAGAGESGQRASYIKEHDSVALRSTLGNERVVIYLYCTLANSLN